VKNVFTAVLSVFIFHNQVTAQVGQPATLGL